MALLSMKTKNDLILPSKNGSIQPIFLERFFYLPKRGYNHEEEPKINWTNLFEKDAPTLMEICSGNGQWIAERALANPEINWVAVEIDFVRARKIWLKSFKQNLPNLFVVCGEAFAFLTHYVRNESVAEVFINFPDPWPKRRHAANRLIQKPFVESLKRVLKKDGFLTLTTDDAPYKNQMMEQCSPFFEFESSELDFDEYGDSFFASLWKTKGKDLFYLKYRNLP